jgi:hypothetical protein
MLTLYVTNNLDGYTGNAFYDYTQQVNSNDDPFGSWYGDLFFVNRRKRLIFTNELTKFSFLVLNYQVRKDVFLWGVFSEHFEYAARNFGINPAPYLKAYDDIGWNTKSNKSCLAHISRLKEEIIPLLNCNYYKLAEHEQQGYFNQIINERLTTYKGEKGYFRPLDVFKEELDKRKLFKSV